MSTTRIRRLYKLCVPSSLYPLPIERWRERERERERGGDRDRPTWEREERGYKEGVERDAVYWAIMSSSSRRKSALVRPNYV